MKKIISLLLLVFCLFSIGGCNKLDFSYFQDKVNNIEGYKYYTITEEIYKEDLLLYRNEKNVYFNNDLVKYVINLKELNDLDSEELYNNSSEEYYIDGSNLYYYSDDEWRVREVSDSTDLGVSLSKDYFESYSFSELNKRKYFKGVLRDDSISSFLGFEVEEANELMLDIEVNSKEVVTLVKFSYVSDNGNKVIVSLKLNYSYILDFSLPISE